MSKTAAADLIREPTIVSKPWGREVWYANEPEYMGKLLEINAGHALSLQYHNEKKETIYVLSGEARYQIDGEKVILGPAACLTLVPGTLHRVEVAVDTVLLEVSTAHPEDVVRVEDRYGRDA